MPSEVRSIRVTVGAIAAVAFLLHTPSAVAVDGVIEINQARALAGGVTPADTPGFPVTLDANGSYRLTGNLTVPNENTTAIQIGTNATYVTIDLNSFSILGAVSCPYPPNGSFCSPSGTGDGVNGNFGAIANSNSNIRVVNGTIRGMGRDGIHVIRGEIDAVNLLHNRQYGFRAEGDGAVVTNSEAISNGVYGFYLQGNGTVVRGSTAGWNRLQGLSVNTALVTNCQVVGNGSDGLDALGPTTVIGNTIFANVDVGVGGFPGSTLNVLDNQISNNGDLGISGFVVGYGRNVLTGNNGANANAQVFGAQAVELPAGSNICGTHACP